uniref:Uncharacterized protein n=1 Tax=Anguilla anguilla TaxID=7936 RepID=A0A0E9WYC1_ANGAN
MQLPPVQLWSKTPFKSYLKTRARAHTHTRTSHSFFLPSDCV